MSEVQDQKAEERDREIADPIVGRLVSAQREMASLLRREIAEAVAKAREEGRREGPQWRPIEIAPWCECCPDGEKWLGPQLLAIRRIWGWEMWVGQCDAGNIWLARADDGSHFETDRPTHWMPLPAPPPQ